MEVFCEILCRGTGNSIVSSKKINKATRTQSNKIARIFRFFANTAAIIVAIIKDTGRTPKISEILSNIPAPNPLSPGGIRRRANQYQTSKARGKTIDEKSDDTYQGNFISVFLFQAFSDFTCGWVEDISTELIIS